MTTLELWYTPDMQPDIPSAEGYSEIRRWHFPAGLIRGQVVLEHGPKGYAFQEALRQIPEDLAPLHNRRKGYDSGWFRDRAHLEALQAYFTGDNSPLPGLNVVELPLGRFETIARPYVVTTGHASFQTWAWMTASFHPRNDLALVVEANQAIPIVEVDLVADTLLRQSFYGPLWKMQPTNLTMRIHHLETHGESAGQPKSTPLESFAANHFGKILHIALEQAGGMLIQPTPTGEFTVLETKAGVLPISEPQILPQSVDMSAFIAELPTPTHRKRIKHPVVVKARLRQVTGETALFADAIIRFDPIRDSDVIVFDNALPPGTLSAETHEYYVKAVFQGILETVSSGLGGFRATLLDAKEHEIDSRPIAFRKIGQAAARLVMDSATIEQ